MNKILKDPSRLMSILFALVFLMSPLYVWRVSIGGLPTNFLMIFVFFVIAAGSFFILKDKKLLSLKQGMVDLGKPMLALIALFYLASIVSLVAFGVTSDKISQWVVLYLQPILIFILIRYFVVNSPESDKKIIEYFKVASYILIGVAGALAILQYFTLFTLPPGWWGNAAEPKRAIAFFAHPNAFSLFVTPILAWLIPDVIINLRLKKYWPVGLWALGGVGVLLSLSRGAWLGLLVAVGVYVFINANKKLLFRFAIVLIVMCAIVSIVPNLRYRVLLPFHGEKSSVARFSLWNTGVAMIKDSPVLGKGVNGFKNNWGLYNKDRGLEHYNFPHNIFLNFWIDSGLLGLLSMLGILGWGIAQGLSNRKNTVALGLLLFIVALVVHGLIDIPYFKNDLALVFWMVLALSL